MEVIQLATPTHFSRGRVERIGLYCSRLFIAFRDQIHLEVWSVHCLVPSSWTRHFSHQFHDLFYAHCAVSPHQNAIFVLVAAFFLTQGIDGGICILRFDLEEEKGVEEYALDEEDVAKFEEVTLERIRLGCGENEGELFLHDQTMVIGQIPFWRLKLHREKMTFSIISTPILDEQNEKCTRYPVLLDGQRRTMLRITNDYQVFLYNGQMECWELLKANERSALDLSTIGVRGISETFGHNWHRFSAIESKLSIFAENGDCCIFKVFQGGIHHFFKFTASMESKTYQLEHCSRAKLDKRLETLCFVHCSQGRMAFANKHLIGFVSIQPPSLREISFWGLQKQFANTKVISGMGGTTAVWNGGKTIAEFRTMFNINQGLKIVD